MASTMSEPSDPSHFEQWRCISNPSSQASNIVLPTRSLLPGRKLTRLRPFFTGFIQAIMNKPLPANPERFDLVQSFDALALADKKPMEKKLPDPPALVAVQPERQNTFVGGFNPELLAVNALLDSQRRPPLVPPAPTIRQNATTALREAEGPRVPSQTQMPIPMPIPRTSKQSLAMQYALESMTLDTPTKPALAPPFVPVPPRPHSDSIVSPKAAPKPPLSAVTCPSPSTLNVTPKRPRTVSVSLSPTTPSPGKNTIQCDGMTRAGRQCFRQVKLPEIHSRLDPTPVLYCRQHREAMITAQPGFYVRKAGSADRFVEFSHYIPKYLQADTQAILRVEMEKAMSPADVSGYIYTFEIRDPKRPDVIQLKVGRAVNLSKRLDQWDKKCGSKLQIPRGWWPGTVEDDDGTGGSLLKGNIKAGDPGPFCHRIERLVHIELMDLSLHAPYLDPDWPNTASDPAAKSPKKTVAKETTCADCGVRHREIFTFPRPDRGRYNGKEWDLIVRPVIEKWGKFIKEYYA